MRQPIRVVELTRSAQDMEILHLARLFAQDNDMKEWIDEDVVLLSCARVRADIDRTHMNCFIAYEGEDAIGFFVGVAIQPFHRRGVVATQVFCYVEPRARGSLAVKRMHQAYEHWARLRGATQFQTSTTNLRYAERASKLFEKLGYVHVGYMHVKEL